MLRNLAAALIVVAGLWQVIGRPVAAWLAPSPTTVAAPASVDLAAAAAVAEGFALDYLAYGGAAYNDHRAAALQHWVDAAEFTDPSSVGQWSGTAVLIPDMSIVEGAQAVGSYGAAVAVRVRVHTATPGPDAGSTPSDIPAPPVVADAAFVPQVPPGYLPGPTYWLQLVVPVIDREGVMVVAAPGPVFSGEGPSSVDVPSEYDPDSSETARGAVEKILPSYALGDLQYVTSQDAHLKGMGGSLTFASLRDVRVGAASASAPHSARMTVTWQVTGVDASIDQNAGLVLEQFDTPAPVLREWGLITPSDPALDD